MNLEEIKKLIESKKKYPAHNKFVDAVLLQSHLPDLIAEVERLNNELLTIQWNLDVTKGHLKNFKKFEFEERSEKEELQTKDIELREALKQLHIENKKLKKENSSYKLLEITQPLLKLGIPITEQKLSRKNPQLVKRRLQVKQMQRGLIRRNKEVEKLREALAFYADNNQYAEKMESNKGFCMYRQILRDRGKTARRALDK